MDASSPAPGSARDDRMEQTLSAAHELFAERGYAAVKMDEIAAAVGVTKPLLYNYFGNKERLYIACMERAGDSLIGDGRRRRGARPPAPVTRSAPASAPSSPSSTATAPPGPSSSTRPSPAAARSSTASPTTAVRSSSWSPARCWRSCRRAAAMPPGSKSRPSPPPCSAPPRRLPAGGCAPRRSAPTTPPSS